MNTSPIIKEVQNNLAFEGFSYIDNAIMYLRTMDLYFGKLGLGDVLLLRRPISNIKYNQNNIGLSISGPGAIVLAEIEG